MPEIGTSGLPREIKPAKHTPDTALPWIALIARCRTLMKVRILIPGRKVDVAYYRCEKCGGEVRQSVPRAR
jgi:hypothetical protein